MCGGNKMYTFQTWPPSLHTTTEVYLALHFAASTLITTYFSADFIVIYTSLYFPGNVNYLSNNQHILFLLSLHSVTFLQPCFVAPCSACRLAVLAAHAKFSVGNHWGVLHYGYILFPTAPDKPLFTVILSCSLTQPYKVKLSWVTHQIYILCPQPTAWSCWATLPQIMK